MKKKSEKADTEKPDKKLSRLIEKLSGEIKVLNELNVRLKEKETSPKVKKTKSNQSKL